MSKPPESTPHSDLDGVHQDGRPNVETATELGQESGDVAHAKEQAVGRPPLSDDGKNRDDRTG